MHQICEKFGNGSRDWFIEVFKFKVVGNIGGIYNMKTITVERLDCFLKLLRLEVRIDLSGIPSPRKMGCLYDLLLKSVCR